METLFPRYTRLCLEYAYAIELTLITALLVQYENPSYSDACIWIIPVVLSKLLISKFSQRTGFFIIILGQVITALSPSFHLPTLPLSPNFQRILLAAVGFTFTDVGLDVVDVVESYNLVSFFARILAFGGSFLLTSFFFSASYYKLGFLEVTQVMYAVSAVMFLPCLLVRLAVPPAEAPAEEAPAQVQPTKLQKVQAFSVIFFGNMLADIILIYGTMWTTYEFVKGDSISNIALKKGICKGAGYLFGYAAARLWVSTQTFDVADVKRRMLVVLLFLGALLYQNFWALNSGRTFLIITLVGYFVELLGHYGNLVGADRLAPSARFLELLIVLSVIPGSIMIVFEQDDIIYMNLVACVCCGLVVFLLPLRRAAAEKVKAQ